MVWRSQRREDAGEELQTHLDLSAVTVPADTAQVSPPGGGSSPPVRDREHPYSQSKLVALLAHFLDVVLQVVEEEFHHVQLLLSPPDSVDTQVSTGAQNQSVIVTTRGLHGDPVRVVAGAKLLEGAEEFGQKTKRHHYRPEEPAEDGALEGAHPPAATAHCTYRW